MKRSAMFVFALLVCVSGVQAMDAYPYTQIVEMAVQTT